MGGVQINRGNVRNDYKKNQWLTFYNEQVPTLVQTS